jgi:hypothetical protein
VKLRADQLISVFENATLELQYGDVKNLGDGRGYTSGRAGFTTANGDALQVVQAYTSQVPGNALSAYLPRLRRLAQRESGSVRGLEGYPRAWQSAAADARFRAAQDAVVDELYLRPALQHAAAIGAQRHLTRVALYEAAMQHGDGDTPDSLRAIIDRATAQVGGTPAGGVDEATWLRAFMAQRRATLLDPGNEATRDAWQASVPRADVMLQILDAGNLDFAGPITFSVFGQTFTLPGAPDVVPPPPPAASEPTPSPTPSPTPLPGTQVDVSFTPTNAEIGNPERGMYTWGGDDLLTWTQADLNSAYARGYRLVFGVVRLDAYRSVALPASVVQSLRTSLALVRQAGLKAVPRFVYNYPQSEIDYRNAQDASLDVVLQHIAQLKPALQDNADVIAFLQAGFVGAWGEWHTSSNDLTAVGNRTRVRDALLDALPASRFLQVRYPGYLMAWSPQVPATTRIGVHNDCFLASATDVGTYSEDTAQRQAERAYVQAVSRMAPFGGETCNPADDPNPQPRGSCSDILAEGRQFSLTYLNDDYFRDLFHNRWQAEGCLAEVKRSIGYRIELVSARHGAQAQAGGAFDVAISVRNVGWAPPFNPRPATVVLRHRGTGQVLRLPMAGVDARAWRPGDAHAASARVSLPAGAAGGEYDMHIALPDGAPRLAEDARYAVRPANADDAARAQAWDATLGAFRLGSTLVVTP